MRDAAFGRDLPGAMSGEVMNVKWPRGLDELIWAFDFLSGHRLTGERGLPQSITLTDMEAGLRQLGAEFMPWHISAISAMDRAYCRAVSEVMADDARRHNK